MDAMDWAYDTTFRFLDLPPELRNLVYRFYLQDSHHNHHLNVATWKQLAPSPALTAVSKQLRSESLGYHRTFFSALFSSHAWYLPLNTSLRCDTAREAVLSTLHAVPKAAAIQELQFSIASFRYSRRGWPVPVVISVSVDEESGNAAWNFRILGQANPFAIVLVRAWLAKLNPRAECYGVKLVEDGRLCVGNCVQVFMGRMHKGDEHFEELSMFFVA